MDHPNGQSLLETLAAVSIGMVLLSIITVTILNALRSTQNSTNQNQASLHAQAGIEIVRQLRDANWTVFDTLSGSYCLADGCSTVSSAVGSCGRSTGACGNNLGIFSRDIIVEKSSASCQIPGDPGRNTRVSVNVRWSDNTCSSSTSLCRQVSTSSCFSNPSAGSGL